MEAAIHFASLAGAIIGTFLPYVWILGLIGTFLREDEPKEEEIIEEKVMCIFSSMTNLPRKGLTVCIGS